MTFQIVTSKGWTEAVIDNDCEYSKFEKVALLLKSNLNIVFIKQFNDFDSYYLDFIHNKSNLCLHYNIYIGLSIFPTSTKDATQSENDNVIDITEKLMTLIQDFNWKDFDNSKSIGIKGSEGGKIIADFEHAEGARITLEKDCGNFHLL